MLLHHTKVGDRVHQAALPRQKSQLTTSSLAADNTTVKTISMAAVNGTDGPSSSAMQSNVEISSRILPHIDRHLALPVLNFLEEHAVYPKEEVLQAKLELLQPTNMVHYLDNVRKELAGDSSDSVSSEVTAKADKIVERREELKSKADTVIEIISNPEVAASLGQDKERNLTTLREKYHVSARLSGRRCLMQCELSSKIRSKAIY